MLATRGWGVDEFRLATPDFLRAARWLVMTEKAMPIYQGAQRNAQTPPMGADIEAHKLQLAASNLVKAWAPWLFPDDDDG